MRILPIVVATLLFAPGLTLGHAADQEPTPQVLLAPAAAAEHVLSIDEAAGLPPTIQGGIGPGSAIRMGVDGIQFICSTSFLLRDPTTMVYYLSTAGHCLVRDNDDATPVNGHDDPGAVMNRIDICVDGCMNNGLGLGTYVSLLPKGDYHPVRYAVSGGVGLDFGLIEIPKELHDHLRPELPQWGGPTVVALDPGGPGALIAHYGHGTLLVPGLGAVVTRTPVDQGRVASLFTHNGQAWDAVGHITGGDSGSAASVAVADPAGVVRGTEALGVITHGIVYVGAPLMLGTTLAHGMQVAGAATGLALELVPEGDPLPDEPPAPAAPDVEVTVHYPASGATVPPGELVIEGNASAADGLPDGTVVQVAIDDPNFAPDHRVPVTGVADWQATWDAEPGVHTLHVRALDGDGVLLAAANATVSVEDPPSSGPEPSEPEDPEDPGQPEEPATSDPVQSDDGAVDSDAPPRSDDAATPGLPVAIMVATLGLMAWRRR